MSNQRGVYSPSDGKNEPDNPPGGGSGTSENWGMQFKPQKNGYIILGIILGHCPEGNIQALMSAKYNEICTQIYSDFESGHDLQIERTMVGILNDGLQYGNWPWTAPPGVSATEGLHIPDLEKDQF